MAPVVLAHGSGIDDLAVVIAAAALVFTLSVTLKRSERRFGDFDRRVDDGGEEDVESGLD
jgi:hypothetical protein